MTNIINITEDEFDATYPLIPNHFDTSASWAVGDGPGCLFKTYGEELDFVRSQDPATIWTVFDDGDLYLVSGYYFVNRIGYLISTKPVPPDVDIECHIPSQPDSE